MKVARLLGLIGLLPGAFTIRDDLEDRIPLEKDSVYPSAFVELRDAAKTKGLVASKAAGRTTSQTVRTGKGRHHEHGTSEGHHRHGHKKHHHGRRHHEEDDDDERSEEEEVSTKDSDRRSEEEDSEDERAPRHRHRKEPEEDEVDEEKPREDEEDEPRKHPSRHSKVKEEKSPSPRSKAGPAPESKTKKTTQATTPTPSKEAAVDHSPPVAPLDVFGAIRACAAWVFPIFGWALVIILVALIALRIKWPELSNMGVRYMAKRMSLPKKRKEGHEKQEKQEEPKQNEEANDQATAAPAPGMVSD